jgi:hypothetical protein
MQFVVGSPEGAKAQLQRHELDGTPPLVEVSRVFLVDNLTLYRRSAKHPLMCLRHFLPDLPIALNRGMATHRRVAFDIGTGMLKMAIADETSGAVEQIPLRLADAQTAMPLGADLEQITQSEDVHRVKFSTAIQERLEQTLLRMAEEAKILPPASAEHTQAGSVDFVGVATQACRKAANGEAMLSSIGKKLGMSLRIINQEEEANIGFLSAVSAVSDVKIAKAVVWDMGGGSFQLVGANDNGQFSSYSGSWGFYPAIGGFCKVTGKMFDLTDLNTSTQLYPITDGDVARYREWLRSSFLSDGPCPHWVSEKLADPEAAVVAMAGCQLIFPAVSPDVTPTSKVSRVALQAAIERRVGKTHNQVLEDEPFLGAARDVDAQSRSEGTSTRFQAWQYLPALILADELMDFFGLPDVQLVEGSLTNGLIADERLWRPAEAAGAPEARRGHL